MRGNCRARGPGSRVVIVWRVLLPLAVLLAVSTHYERSHGGACASCHEIWQPYTDWHTPRIATCLVRSCHGDVFTLNAGFHINNMRRVFTHLRGDAPAKVRLRTQTSSSVPRCQKCHQQEWAAWQSSTHSATYAEIFLDSKHNHSASF